MKKKESFVSLQNKKIIGKSRQEIYAILASNHIFYKDKGDIIYYTKYLFFFKRWILVSFDENDIADTTINLKNKYAFRCALKKIWNL